MNLKNYLKKIDLEKLLEELKIENIISKEDNIQASCPFHNDKKPSWGINRHNGKWHCFTCQSNSDNGSGNLISLIMRIKGLKWHTACDFLRNWAGFKLNSIVTPKNVKSRIKQLICPKQDVFERQAEDEYIMRTQMPRFLSRDYYYGIKYFKDRGINQDTINKANISFCTKGFYKNRAIIPYFDDEDKMIGFEARDITRLQEKKVLFPKNCKINNNLYNINKAKNMREVIVVEGTMDTLYLMQNGFNVVSTCGANISIEQANILYKYFDKIYLAYDGDNVGYFAMIKYGKKLALHLLVYIITLPNGKDPDEISGQEFRHLYENAEEINHFLSKKIFKKRKK